MKKQFIKFLTATIALFLAVNVKSQTFAVPVTGTTPIHPLTGAIEYRGASGGTAIADSIGEFLIGGGNSKNLSTASKGAIIDFSGTASHAQLLMIGKSTSGNSSLKLQDNIYSLIFTNAANSFSHGFTSAVGGFGIFANDATGAYSTKLNTTPTSVFLQSNNPSYKASFEANTCNIIWANRDSTSFLNKGSNDRLYAPSIIGGYIPLSGTGVKPLTGSIEYRGLNNGTALVDTSVQNFYIGAGNRKDLQSATNFSYINFYNDGSELAEYVSDGTNETNFILNGSGGRTTLNSFDGTNITGFQLAPTFFRFESDYTSYIGAYYDNPCYGYVLSNYNTQTLAPVGLNNILYAPISYTAHPTTTLSGDVTGTGTNTITTTLANTAVIAGTYSLSSITVDAKGRITSASSGTVSSGSTLTLTTTGTSGASTYSAGILNVPQYQGALTNPITGTGTNGQSAFFTGSTTQSSDANYFWDNTNKRLGLGNNVPVSILHTVETSTSTTRGINSDQYSATGGSRITMRTAGGTFLSPSAVATGRGLGSWTVMGYDGTNFIDAAKILVTSAGTIGTNTVPATMALQTANAAGALTTALIIDQSQNSTFTGSVTASTVIKSGGTSSQFLKADGSVDANSYITNTVTTLSSLSSVGTLTTGVWNATKIGLAYGGTNTDLSAGGAVGDLIQGATSTTFSRLASVAAGSYLRSVGTGSLNVWSTMTLPNAISTTAMMFGSGTNSVGTSTNVAWDNTNQKLTIQGLATAGAAILAKNNAFNVNGDSPIVADDGHTVTMGLGYGGATTTGYVWASSGNGVRIHGFGSYGVYCETNFTNPQKSQFGAASTSALTAIATFGAGTATAGTAPLKFTSGTNLTTTEAGAIEYNGSHLYFTAANAGTRYQLDQQGVSNYVHSISTPTTGATVNLTNNSYNIINPAGALLALTVNLPSSPANNDVVYIKFTQNITTVTYANGTVVDGITAPTAGGLTVLVYDSGTNSWY